MAGIQRAQELIPFATEPKLAFGTLWKTTHFECVFGASTSGTWPALINACCGVSLRCF